MSIASINSIQDIDALSLEEMRALVAQLETRHVVKKYGNPDNPFFGVFRRADLRVLGMLDDDIIPYNSVKPVRYYGTQDEAEDCLAIIG